MAKYRYIFGHFETAKPNENLPEASKQATVLFGRPKVSKRKVTFSSEFVCLSLHLPVSLVEDGFNSSICVGITFKIQAVVNWTFVATV